MSAPILWILVPLAVAGMLLLLRNQNAVIIIACFVTFLLTLAALMVPFDTGLTFGGMTVKLAPSLQVLGRRLTLSTGDRSFLALIYGSSFLWFVPALTVPGGKRLIPLGLAITALLVASIAVEPFLYAALLIETAVLLSIPLLATPGQKIGKGLLRFLIFQTLALPFILFSGWILAGIEANPGNLELVRQAAIFLGFGFAFLLAIFPFYSWIPLLSEETEPYIFGFILWMLPTVTLFFGMGFLDHYSWLRDTGTLGTVLTTAGILMVLSGGILAAFQHNLGRMMGYAVMVETGFSLLAMSLVNRSGANPFLLLLVSRTLCLGVWALSLSVLKDQHAGLDLADVKGIARKMPFAAIGVTLSSLAVAGVPLLALFPIHQVVWEAIAQQSLSLALCILIGSLGIAAGSIRTLIAFVSNPEGAPWEAYEKSPQRVVLSIAWLAMFLLGIFPQWVLPLWSNLPALFTHLK